VTLRPSISRAEYATLPELMECAEVRAIQHYGTLHPAQQEWIDTWGTVPPPVADIELHAKEALAYEAVSDGDDDNGIHLDFTPEGAIAA
jgi:hypothetical protein